MRGKTWLSTRPESGRRSGVVALVAGFAVGLVGVTGAQAGFGDGMSIGDGTNTDRNRARTLPLRNELGNRINAGRMAAGQAALAGAALEEAKNDALEALRCHIMLLGDLANCQIEDDFGEDAGDTWGEMLGSGRVCVIAGGGYRGACRTDGVATDERDRININLDILPFDEKHKTLWDLLLAQPSVSSSALTLYEEIRHAQQDWDWPARGDRSTEARVRQRLRAVCNERDVDDLQLAATCDALDAIENLENDQPAGATTEFGAKIAECLDAVMDDPLTKGVDERQVAFDAVKGGLLGRKAFTGGTGDANDNGELDEGEDLNGDGMIDRLGTRGCYNAGKQAYQAWLDSDMNADDLNDLNNALRAIRWATRIPGQLGPVAAGAPVPREREPGQIFSRGSDNVVSQFIATDSVDHELHTPLLLGVQDMLLVPPGPGNPGVLFVGGSIVPGQGGLFAYADIDSDGAFDQFTETPVLVPPVNGGSVIGLVLPPGAPMDEMIVVVRNDPLFFPNDDIVPHSVVDLNGDDFPDQLGPPIGPPMLDPLNPLSFGPGPGGQPQELIAGPEQPDGTVGDLDALLVSTPTFGVEVYLDEVQPFPPFPMVPVLPGETFTIISGPPGMTVELYQVDPLGVPPVFTPDGIPLQPPITQGVAGPDSLAFMDIPPLNDGDVLVARVAETGALSVDIPVGLPGPQPCNIADLAAPFGVLDLGDLNAFISAFTGGDLLADMNNDGLLDLTDVNQFVSAFVGGCP